MDLQIARRHAQRRLRLVHGVVEVAARGERLRHPVMPARQFGCRRQGVLVFALRLLEQPH
jgi:hypothetical protein